MRCCGLELLETLPREPEVATRLLVLALGIVNVCQRAKDGRVVQDSLPTNVALL